MLIKKKAQNTAEYAILIGLIIAAATAMQTYIKRGLQARIKGGVDYVATQTSDLGTQTQYEPYYLESNFNTNSTRETTESEAIGGSVNREIAVDETTRTGVQKYNAYREQ